MNSTPFKPSKPTRASAADLGARPTCVQRSHSCERVLDSPTSLRKSAKTARKSACATGRFHLRSATGDWCPCCEIKQKMTSKSHAQHGTSPCHHLQSDLFLGCFRGTRPD